MPPAQLECELRRARPDAGHARPSSRAAMPISAPIGSRAPSPRRARSSRAEPTRLKLSSEVARAACRLRAIAAAEHQMVEHRAVERFGRASRGGGWRAVRLRSARGIAARVVVGEDDPGAAVERGVGDDLRAAGSRRRSRRRRGATDGAARLVVEMGDPQAFAARVAVGEAAGEEAPRRRRGRRASAGVRHADSACAED